MISVIMPTMWRGGFYKEMLPQLNENNLIGEIIIIDNDTSSSDQQVLALSKVKHYPMKENIYVNPAWNLGVKLSAFDKVCLYSDDVLFDTKCLDSVCSVLTPENGIIGFAVESISESHSTLDFLCSWEELTISKINSMHYRFGMCMFMHKQSYYEIPEQLKIYYGDSYIFDRNVMNGKSHYAIYGCSALTKMRTTSKNTIFDEIKNNDKKEYCKINPTEEMIIELMDKMEREML